MKTYSIKYHIIGKSCCGRKPKPSVTVQIEANSVDEAREKLRKKVPGARFESIEEVVL